MTVFNPYFVPAGAVRVGDYLSTSGGAEESTFESVTTVRVTSTKAGTKYTNLYQEETKLVAHILSDSMTLVFREEETPEERETRYMAHALKSLADDLESGLKAYNPEKLLMDALLDRKGERKAYLSGAIFSELDSLLKGQAKYDLLSQINHLYTDGNDAIRGDLIKSFAVVLAEILEPNRRAFRSLSKSTSVTSNLCEDVVREMAHEMLNDWRAGGYVRKAVYALWADCA